MPFSLYTSNRLELLADKLAETVSQPLPSPLTPETIIVQSFGMQQWIALELARRFGVWANCRYPFPNAFLQDMFRLLVPDAPDTALFDRDVLTWRIMRLLPQCIDKPGFELLRAYLEQDSGCFRAWQLSRQIANLFDQYGIYRPKMILRWAEGNGAGWQADLWRLLVREQPAAHSAAVRQSFFRVLAQSPRDSREKIPPRVSVFGISTLPPFHLDVLAALAQHCDVHVFLMTPSQEYWAEIKSDYEITRQLHSEGRPYPSAENLHLETGNSLLASMGRLGRDFLGIIMDYDPVLYPCFEEPAGNDLLHAIQADLLTMVDRGAAREEGAKQLPLSAEQLRADNSISIHSCHSPMREVEVLHDFLLDVFNNDPAIKPRDILVMMPDSETYAPFIQAVFVASGENNGHIPYEIADQTVRRQSTLAKTCFAVLRLGTERFGVSRVLDILECAAVQRRFNLLPADIDCIHRWVRETRICWGRDGAFRSSLGLPPFKQTTWQAGVERLLLGYAMPQQEERLFSGILPYGTIEGSDAHILGGFLSFLDALFNAVPSSGALLPPVQWQEKLLSLVDALFLPDDDAQDELQTLRTVIERLGTLARQAGFTGPVGLDVVLSWLDYAAREEYIGRRFLTGGVTFCAMLPMRSIPFKVICMIGMQDAAFPRKASTHSFDLIARWPRRGDRSLRADDRYLFLEAVMSAREKLYISYAGQGIQDNSELPPSVLVSELLDYIEQGYIVPDREGDVPRNRIRDCLVVKHRLQAFSPRYFDGQGMLYSYSAEQHEAGRALLEERREPAPFITGGLSAPESEQKIITIQDLTGFYDNPVKFLLNRTLGLYLGEQDTALEEREPFALDGLDKYQLEQRLCESCIKGQDVSSVRCAAASAGMLPLGVPGDCSAQALMPQLRRFSETVRSYMPGEPCSPAGIACACGGYYITGTVHNVWPGMLLRYRCTPVKARDRLRQWILHLILNAGGTDCAPVKSILIGTDGVWETAAQETACRQILGKLAALYYQGQQRPLHFFPDSALAYAAALQKGKDPQDALTAARAVWAGNDYRRGECEDPYYRRCFSGTDPLDGEFETLAGGIFGPLIDAQKQVTR